jgi:hypothetical protein
MRRRVAELVAVGIILATALAHADGGARTVSLVAEVACDPVPGPGKVQCVVRVRPVGGVLRWSDAIVLSAPPFAPPLRTRVAAGDARRNDAEGADFALALAATADGIGELKILARATVCGDGGCRPVQAEGTARVAVGTSPSRPGPEVGPAFAPRLIDRSCRSPDDYRRRRWAMFSARSIAGG